MNSNKLRGVALLSCISLSVIAIPELLADDPLNAFPTTDSPAEDRVKQLPDAELKMLQLAGTPDELVFSIATVPSPEAVKQGASEPEPWLRVFADGRINCGSRINTTTLRRDDKLTNAELMWLLHLAVNECKILSRTTPDIQVEKQEPGQKRPREGASSQLFKYHLKLLAGENDLQIPERALVLQPLRARMKLIAFGSLHKYANFLVSRAFLGEPAERQSLLEQLNRTLEREDANIPAFRMEHLGAANSAFNVGLFAMFQQEVELEQNRFKQVSGTIIRKDKDAEPTFTIRTTNVQKYRPFSDVGRRER
jgi:hypothetical protein